MTGKILIRVYPNLPIDKKEVLRYAGVTGEAAGICELVDSVIEEVGGELLSRVCYREFEIKRTHDELDLEFCRTDSRSLMKSLSHCEKIILFAATVGGKIDRLMSKYAIASPVKALLLQAFGTERIEALADAFSLDVKREAALGGYLTTPRFSPGYGDLSLSVQREIFIALEPPKKIGLSLGESLIMSPTKSITAIIGLRKNENH